MRNFKFYLLVFSILLTFTTFAFADAVDLGISGIGARPLGMGKAFTAIADDTNAIFLNPAGLASANAWGVTSMTTKLIDTVDYKMVGGLIPTARGVFGIGYIDASASAGYRIDTTGAVLSSSPITYSSSFLILSYGNRVSIGRIQNLGIGLNLKMINNGFSGLDASASGMDADIGFIINPNDKLALGLNYQNVMDSNLSWDADTKEDVPSALKLGAGYKIRDNLLLALDFEFASQSPLLIHTGLEFRPFKIIALRAGIDQNPTSSSSAGSDLTAGLGINFRGFSFDYAYKSNSIVENDTTHYFSLSFSPEQLKVAEKEKAVKVAEKVSGVKE